MAPGRYLDGVRRRLKSLVTDEEVEILDTLAQSPDGLVTDLGGLLDGDARRDDVLRLCVASVAHLGVAVNQQSTLQVV